MCTAQCGSMEAKASLSIVLRAASSAHYKSSTRRVFTYVVGGRVGMNDTCYFTLDMKKLDHAPPMTCVASTMCASARNIIIPTPPQSPPHAWCTARTCAPTGAVFDPVAKMRHVASLHCSELMYPQQSQCCF